MLSGAGPFDPLNPNRGWMTRIPSYFDEPRTPDVSPVEPEVGRYMTLAPSWFDIGGGIGRPYFANGGGYEGDALLADYFTRIRQLGKTLKSARDELIAVIEGKPTTQNFNRLGDLEQEFERAFANLEAEVARAEQAGFNDSRLASVRRLADIVWGGAGLGPRVRGSGNAFSPSSEISPLLLVVQNEINRLGNELKPVLAQLYAADAALNRLGDNLSPRAVRILELRNSLLVNKQAIIIVFDNIMEAVQISSLWGREADQIAVLIDNAMRKADADARAAAGVDNSGPSSSGASTPPSSTPPPAPAAPSGSGGASAASLMTTIPEFFEPVVSEIPITEFVADDQEFDVMEEDLFDEYDGFEDQAIVGGVSVYEFPVESVIPVL